MTRVNEDQIYLALARRFVPFTDLITIPCVDNGDPMVDVETYGLKIDLSYSQLEPSTKNRLFLRQDVCKRLVQVQEYLTREQPGDQLILVYAYRSMHIQQSRFEQMKAELGYGHRTDTEAMEATHHFIAVPKVAGHPTGGAIDLLIVSADQNPHDFGTAMHALERQSYVFSPFISDIATLNRKLLRRVMMAAGFAPYDGEWWHFSYGDPEWAAHYRETCAFYQQLEQHDDSFLPSI